MSESCHRPDFQKLEEDEAHPAECLEANTLPMLWPRKSSEMGNACLLPGRKLQCLQTENERDRGGLGKPFMDDKVAKSSDPGNTRRGTASPVAIPCQGLNSITYLTS